MSAFRGGEGERLSSSSEGVESGDGSGGDVGVVVVDERRGGLMAPDDDEAVDISEGVGSVFGGSVGGSVGGSGVVVVVDGKNGGVTMMTPDDEEADDDDRAIDGDLVVPLSVAAEREEMLVAEIRRQEEQVYAYAQKLRKWQQIFEHAANVIPHFKEDTENLLFQADMHRMIRGGEATDDATGRSGDGGDGDFIAERFARNAVDDAVAGSNPGSGGGGGNGSSGGGGGDETEAGAVAGSHEQRLAPSTDGMPRFADENELATDDDDDDDNDNDDDDGGDGDDAAATTPGGTSGHVEVHSRRARGKDKHPKHDAAADEEDEDEDEVEDDDDDDDGGDDADTTTSTATRRRGNNAINANTTSDGDDRASRSRGDEEPPTDGAVVLPSSARKLAALLRSMEAADGHASPSADDEERGEEPAVQLATVMDAMSDMLHGMTAQADDDADGGRVIQLTPPQPPHKQPQLVCFLFSPLTTNVCTVYTTSFT